VSFSARQSISFAKRSAILLLCGAVTLGCVSRATISGQPNYRRQIAFGESGQGEIHHVSVVELLGRPSEFDGQPVGVIGVASFDFGFEGVSALYATPDDEHHNTDALVRIGSLSPGLKAPPEELEKFTGKYVQIVGTFRARPLKRIPQVPGQVVVCMGDCRTSGVLEDVTRVSFWEY
jgi:hypothetical protein